MKRPKKRNHWNVRVSMVSANGAFIEWELDEVPTQIMHRYFGGVPMAKVIDAVKAHAKARGT